MKSRERKYKRNAVVLLLALFLYAFVLVFVFNQNDGSAKHIETTSAQTDLVAVTNNLEYKKVEEVEQVQGVTDSGGQVRGEQDYVDSSVKDFIEHLRDFFVGSCDEPQYEIFQPQLFCGGSGGLEGDDIKIAQIWAPDILFVGAAVPYDNLVQTSNPDGRTAFRNASEMLNPDFDYYINMPPDNGEILESTPLGDEEKFEIYDMHYEAAGELNEIPFDVHPEEESKCPEVVNGGEFNVKGSNNLQKELTDSVTPPGRMLLGDRDATADLCREERVIELDEDDSFLLCNEGFFDTAKCAAENLLRFEDKCDDIGDLVIDAPLGSGEICSEDDCSIRYSEAGRILTAPPTWTDEELYPDTLSAEEKENDYIVDDPVILTTPCYVRVDCQICATRCRWDISMWQHVFQLEKMYTYPGYENEMDEDTYWQAVEDEIKWRGRFGVKRY